MLDDDQVTNQTTTPAAGAEAPADPPGAAPAKKAAAKRAPAKKAAAKKAPAKKAAAKKAAPAVDEAPALPLDVAPETAQAPAKKAAAKRAPAKKTTARKTAAKKQSDPAPEAAAPEAAAPAAAAESSAPGTTLLFKAPEPTTAPRRRTRKSAPAAEPTADETTTDADDAAVAEDDAPAPSQRVTTRTRQPRKRAQATPVVPDPTDEDEDDDEEDDSIDTSTSDRSDDESDTNDDGEGGGGRRRRRRGGRRRRKPGDGEANQSDDGDDSRSGERQDGGRQQNNQRSNQGGGQGSGGGNRQGGNNRGGNDSDADSDEGSEATSRRRRRRRRAGDDGPEGQDDPQNTVIRVRKQRSAEDEITAISGSTRLEAKKQRRRDGREAGRRRAPIVSEAEFLARREAVERVMVVRQREDLTQIAVLEDKVLVEHYVARESQVSIIGNVYLGRVQNVLPSMEAAFIDIGKGRNAVLYAGEVNWSALGQKDGGSRKIESVLSSGQSVLVQVTKDPIGHKGARLSSQVSLAGRFLVYVPDGTTSGISRKLPDTERNRLKTLLKEIVPEGAGVIVRTAAEGATEEELTRDVERLKARWEDIEAKVKGSSPQLLYGEPDLTLKVVRDLFTEDFTKLVIEGDDAWDTVQGYVRHVAPDLEDRLERYDRSANNGKDTFAAYRIDEQIAKGLDRKVWLPSGGSLVIDRTEAMTVVDVNTGKFTGSGGNLEETVTKNNLEAAEEMVRQLRLRDIGGIIVIDFIDMVLESNRDLVLRRLVECLGRDRTRHQVAEVTSLGLVQMTRKRIGTGLVEAFSENCTHCQGRGVVIQDAPVEPKNLDDEDSRRGGARRTRGGGRGRDSDDQQSGDSGDNNGRGNRSNGGRAGAPPAVPSPKDIAAAAKPEPVAEPDSDESATAAAPGTPSEAPAEPAVTTRQRSRRSRSAQPAEYSQEPTAVETVAPEPSPQQVVEPVVDSGAPKVVTRTRRSRSAQPTEPAPEPVVVETVAPEPVVETPVPATAPVVDPGAPKVVTRTRRRSTSAPTTVTAGEPAAIRVEPVAPAAEQAAPVTEPTSTVTAPKVVTRTRGRSATRPAGPPVVDGQPVAAVDGDGQSVEHVPVKKKGTRKR